jgi:uncharacterized NAD-dependent epimerase/dehydratase family protein
MNEMPEGNAVVWCEGAFTSTYGKTAHGLVRRTRRYVVEAVIDSTCAGRDAGEVLDGRPVGIPVVPSLDAALRAAEDAGKPASHLVIGVATDGGVLPPAGREVVAAALREGLNVDCGLHEFLGDDPELSALAERHGARIRDVRRPPARGDLHFFDGRIDEVGSWRVAILGTDSAVGKRTTAWLLVDALEELGRSVVMLGTGQTAWMQGADYSIVLDSLVNDFVAGEIEHMVWSAWDECRPDVMVLEGQGSIMHPAFPGGFEILAAARPHVVVVQHAPGRRDYDGFPGRPVHPLAYQIRAIELVGGAPVVAVALNREGLDDDGVHEAQARLVAETGLPVHDPLREGGGPLARSLLAQMDAHPPAAPASAPPRASS